MSTTGKVTIVVADDHPAILQVVCDAFEEKGIDVVGRARNGEEAVTAIEAHRPLVALLDLEMPRLGGIQVAEQVARTAPETLLVFYTGYGDAAQLNEALDVGARGFVLKEAPLHDLLRAVELVASGGTYVDPVLAGSIATSRLRTDVPGLSQREREVLRLLSDGHSNEEIGKRLFISPETVRTYVRKAMAKLEADTRTQAVATALRQHLIS